MAADDTTVLIRLGRVLYWLGCGLAGLLAILGAFQLCLDVGLICSSLRSSRRALPWFGCWEGHSAMCWLEIGPREVHVRRKNKERSRCRP
jgi:hypothetical protein